MGNLPYAQRAGTLEKMLEKIKTASVPEKFSQDFVSTKLAMKGGPPRSTIPFIKKMGLVSSDGTPTQRYHEFRNSDKSGFAVADSMREVYSTLFEMNEYVYELDNTSLKRLIVEATGAEPNSASVAKTLSSFNALKNLADFSAKKPLLTEKEEQENNVQNNTPMTIQNSHPHETNVSEGINLSYTINLNLPPTTDIEVFNSIFKSLKQHLLRG